MLSDCLDVAVVESESGLLTYKLFDIRRDMWINGEQLSKRRNFAHIGSILLKSCELGVITSQMYRSNRRCFYSKQFMNETADFAKKMILFG